MEEAYLGTYKDVFNSYSYNLGEYAGILPLSIASEKLILQGLADPIGNYNFKQFQGYARETLISDLKEQVGISLLKGENPVKLAKRLETIFGDSIKRITATSRTELLRAYSVAQDESITQALEMGIEFKYVWRARLDSRVRDSHRAENGKKADIDKNGMPVFTVGQSKGTGPRLLYGPDQAKQTISCRCRRLNVPVTN
jgi:SPP1 gp7 family putative phage head morphogenesis protein